MAAILFLFEKTDPITFCGCKMFKSFLPVLSGNFKNRT